MAFLPELVLLAGALVLFVVTLGEGRVQQARAVALITALAAIVACVVCLGAACHALQRRLSRGPFSQVLKLVFAGGFALILLLSGKLEDIRDDIKPEYFLFLTLSVIGLIMLVSCVDIITLVIALEVSAFPLYFLVAMRREREGQKSQMESAIKYIMFGVAANGVMFFGMSYLFGLTGTTSLTELLPRLQPQIHSPLAIAGLALTFCGLYYKLAVFPFHFWTPDVYQGASNETAGLVASLPKIGAVAVLVRFVSLASPDNHTVALMLAILAVGLDVLRQPDRPGAEGLQAAAGLLRHRPCRLRADRLRRARPAGLRRRPLLHHRLPADGAGLLCGDLQGLARRHQRRDRRAGRAAPALAAAGADAGRRACSPWPASRRSSASWAS